MSDTDGPDRRRAPMASRTGTRVVVLGGGLGGLEVARRLERSPRLEVTVVDEDGLHVYQPLLPEVASGLMEPRHAVIPLRRALRRATVVNGRAVARGDHVVRVCRRDGRLVDLPYDHLVLAVGGVTRVLPIPGLVERAVGFRTVAEALHLRDRVLDRMQLADASADPAHRTRALTFVFVGAGYSGVEAAGELRDMAVEASADFDGVSPGDLRFVLVEATDEVLPMVAPALRAAAIADLRRRNIEVRLHTLVESVDDGGIHLSDSTTVPADTLVWCAGGRPHPVVDDLDVPQADDGAVEVLPTLQVPGIDSVWALGDCAAVPDEVRGGRAPASAQYAVRAAKQLAENIELIEAGETPKELRYRQRGELVTLGRYSAVGEVFGVRLRGWPAWGLRAGYHLARYPSALRRLRVGLDWLVNLVFPREITSLGSVRDPDRPLHVAAAAMHAPD